MTSIPITRPRLEFLLLTFGILASVLFIPQNHVTADCVLNQTQLTCLDKLCTGVPVNFPLLGHLNVTCPTLCMLDGYATGTCSEVISNGTMIQTCACTGRFNTDVPPNVNTTILFTACESACPEVCGSCGFGLGKCTHFSDGTGIYCNCPLGCIV